MTVSDGTTPVPQAMADRAAARRRAASDARNAELRGIADMAAPPSPTGHAFGSPFAPGHDPYGIRPGFDPHDPVNPLRSDLNAAERQAWQAAKAKAQRAPLDDLRKVVGLDMRSQYSAGTIRAIAYGTPREDAEASAILRELSDEVDRWCAEQPQPSAARPRMSYPQRVEMEAERQLSGAELELLRRLPTDTAKLTDDDVDLLLSLDAEVGGTDRELVKRALGDAAEKRFERQRAEYVKALRGGQPAPVGTHSAARERLRNLIAKRTAEEAPDLAAAMAAAPEAIQGRTSNLVLAEGRERAADLFREAAAATVAKWQEEVAQAEALPIPQPPGVRSPGMARGVREAQARARREQRVADPFARLTGRDGGGLTPPPAVA